MIERPHAETEGMPLILAPAPIAEANATATTMITTTRAAMMMTRETMKTKRRTTAITRMMKGNMTTMAMGIRVENSIRG